MYFWTPAGGSALSRNASLQIRTQEAESIQRIKVSAEHGSGIFGAEPRTSNIEQPAMTLATPMQEIAQSFAGLSECTPSDKATINA